MRNIVKLVCAGLVLCAGTTMFAYGPVSRSSSVGVSEANALSASKKLYLANCARCHGADGKSMTPQGMETDAPDLTLSGVQSMSSSRMARIIAKGDGEMPGFGKKLKAAQIASIVKYVKSF